MPGASLACLVPSCNLLFGTLCSPQCIFASPTFQPLKRSRSWLNLVMPIIHRSCLPQLRLSPHNLALALLLLESANFGKKGFFCNIHDRTEHAPASLRRPLMKFHCKLMPFQFTSRLQTKCDNLHLICFH